MQMKEAGKYRPVTKDDKNITKRERRLGRVVVTPQVNYKKKEWGAKLHAEDKRRQFAKRVRKES